MCRERRTRKKISEFSDGWLVRKVLSVTRKYIKNCTVPQKWQLDLGMCCWLVVFLAGMLKLTLNLLFFFIGAFFGKWWVHPSAKSSGVKSSHTNIRAALLFSLHLYPVVWTTQILAYSKKRKKKKRKWKKKGRVGRKGGRREKKRIKVPASHLQVGRSYKIYSQTWPNIPVVNGPMKTLMENLYKKRFWTIYVN